jgi:hypothetical protein
MVHPDAELAAVTPDVEYRVRKVFEYLPDGRPPAAAWRPAATRLAALLLLPAAGVLAWLGLLAVEALASRRSVDPAFVEERFRALTPEMLRALSGGRPPALADLLARLGGERKLAIELGPPGEDDDETEVRMRLLVPATSLPAFERAALEGLFPEGGNETSRRRLREVYAVDGFDPEASFQATLATATPAAGQPVRSPAAAVLGLIALAGVGLQAHALTDMDLLPIVVLANFLAGLFALRLWPRRWWHGGRPRRSAVALLYPLAALTAAVAAFHLAVARPLPADAWLGTTLAALACYLIVLGGSRMPTRGEPFESRRATARIRRFAAAELRKAAPRLSDKWVAHLEALGLGGELARWRERHGDAAQAVPELGDGAAAVIGPRFRGRGAMPFAGPPGWTDALYVLSAEEREAERADQEADERA